VPRTQRGSTIRSCTTGDPR